jgi:hypothetical protein
MASTGLGEFFEGKTFGDLKAIGLTICDLSLKTCVEIFEGDKHLRRETVFLERAISFRLDDEDDGYNVVVIKKHNIKTPDEAPIDGLPVFGSTLSTLEDVTKVTVEIFVLLCFSVYCNMGPLKALQAYHKKHGSLPTDLWKRAFLAHFFWAMQQWELKAIQEDPICKHISKYTDLQLSLDLFSSEMSDTHVYVVEYLKVFLNPTEEQIPFIKADSDRIEKYANMLELK